MLISLRRIDGGSEDWNKSEKEIFVGPLSQYVNPLETLSALTKLRDLEVIGSRLPYSEFVEYLALTQVEHFGFDGIVCESYNPPSEPVRDRLKSIRFIRSTINWDFFCRYSTRQIFVNRETKHLNLFGLKKYQATRRLVAYSQNSKFLEASKAVPELWELECYGCNFIQSYSWEGFKRIKKLTVSGSRNFPCSGLESLSLLEFLFVGDDVPISPAFLQNKLKLKKLHIYISKEVKDADCFLRMPKLSLLSLNGEVSPKVLQGLKEHPALTEIALGGKNREIAQKLYQDSRITIGRHGV